MRYLALATDYDGTLAHHGQVDHATLMALARLRESGRRLLLVTGRLLGDLLTVFPEAPLFDRIIAENGALVYNPATKEEKVLGEPPPRGFIERLRRSGVMPLDVGRVIAATWTPHETTVLEAIRELGLERQVIFNKGAVMILPSGVNKAAGLAAALKELGLSPHNVVGVGDAENDQAFLALCEFSAAVANALPAIKERVHYVAGAAQGEGVIELIDRIIGNDLKDFGGQLAEHAIAIGRRENDAGGELGADLSFYFRGPEGKLNLRAPNLTLFLQLAGEVDDATWEYHRRRGDYSRWIREAVKDEELARAAEAIERDETLSAAESRARFRDLIQNRYTEAA